MGFVFRIAFTALGTWIASQAAKIDSLQTHKKGSDAAAFPIAGRG